MQSGSSKKIHFYFYKIIIQALFAGRKYKQQWCYIIYLF